MAGVKAPWWKWCSAEYIAGVMVLDLRQQGAWMRLISHAQMNGENPGHVQANLAWLGADFKETVEEAWGLLVTLALLKICNVWVDTGDGMKPLDESFLGTAADRGKPAPHWRFEVVARRVERDAIARQKEIERKYGKPDNGPSSGDGSRTMGHLPTKSGYCPRARRTRTRTRTRGSPYPLNEQGSGKPDGGRKKKVGRVSENTPLMARIGSWFGRRETTLWAVEEAEKLSALNPQEDEIEVLERYFASEHPEIKPYRRRQVITLLNNWTGDLDKARAMLERYPDDGQEVAGTAHGGRRMADMAVV